MGSKTCLLFFPLSLNISVKKEERLMRSGEFEDFYSASADGMHPYVCFSRGYRIF